MARPSLERNVKFKSLVQRLRLPKPYVRGLLETMWDVAHECGNPILGTAEDVEYAAEWPGKKGTFFEAIKGTFVDPLRDGRWMLHDYWHHAPEYVKNRRRMEEKRKGSQGSNPDQPDGSFNPKIDCKDDSSIDKGLRSDCVEHFNTRAVLCDTPAPAPAPGFNSPNGEFTATDVAASPGEPDDAEDVTPAGDPAPRPDAPTKPRPRRAPPTGPHHELIAFFTSAWRQRFGGKYDFQDAADGAAAGRLLKKTCENDLAKAKRIVSEFIEDDDAFISEGGHTLRQLASQVNRYTSGGHKAKARARTTSPTSDPFGGIITELTAEQREHAKAIDWRSR
jgi:hypothetical protein